MADTRQFEPTHSSASSDDEIVAALQRLAHAQALLFQAENDITSPGEDAARLGERNREIEEAHTKLLWTQAETLNAPRGDRTPKILEPHRKREQQALAKFGFAAFDEYLDDRARRPTNNINLAKARREYRAAHEHWEQILLTKGTPGVAPPAPVGAPAAVATAAAASATLPSNEAASAAAPPTFAAPAPATNAHAPGSDGLAPSMRMGLGAAAAIILLLAGFMVVKSRNPSADASLSTATLPTTSLVAAPSTTAARSAPVSSIPKSVPAPTTTVSPVRGGPTSAVTPTTVAVPTTVSVDRTAALCASAKIFSLDDLLGLGERAVANPKSMLQAYESMALTAPPNLTPHMQALGPVTRAAIAQIQSGKITTAAGLQKWLADEAPRADLEQWIAAQAVIVPALKELCVGN